nr:MAG TPA_asm: NinG protein [Caudoviricetes sp.]
MGVIMANNQKKRPRRKCTVCREWFNPVRHEQYV